MTDLLAKLKAGRDALGTVEVNGVKLGLRILVEQDYQEAGLAADALLAEHNTELSLSNSEVFEAEKTIQLIARAAVDPANKQPVFPTADEARSTLARHDKDRIIEKYLEHEKKFSPSYRTLSDEEFDALIEEVKKNPETTRLNDLSGDLLRRLTATLASQLSSLQKDSGSSS
ncbi:hypothetical protein EDC30_102217 [Paucimonas lemoignei]|uniref:Uncharacterized protein n=1 Tax=Paucimonas lemoignei TaxID=29443 RepID=A0A4R3HZ15_PAULE|nr:hypothetical protein [Paucimonas lemoignei]TCS38478.1 hypothetical protein EDC30_102217 [Paucimonas lemoignei]